MNLISLEYKINRGPINMSNNLPCENSDNDIEIKGMIKSSFLDWDGKIVTTLYLSNCNLHCPFCHNWELIEKPENFNTVPWLEIERHLQSNRDFIDGICITGGEPTLYSGLLGLIEDLIALGFSIKLDTNGTHPEVLEQLINEDSLDYVAMDVKGPLDERYNKLSGCKVDLDNIKKSIEILLNSSIDYEFRTTIVPTLLDIKDIEDIGPNLMGAKKFAFQQFVRDHARNEKLRDIVPYDKDVFKKMQNKIKRYVDNVVIRGVKQL